LGDGGVCAFSKGLDFAFMQIDLETAKSIIAKQFPHWAALPISAFDSSGTDHQLFRLGDHMAARFPITGDAARSVEDEWIGLRRFSGLPLVTPQLLATGKPELEFPTSWSVVNWINGQDASVATVSDWQPTAYNLGVFVRALRAVEPASGRMCGSTNGFRGSPLSTRAGWVRNCFDSVADLFDHHAMRLTWEEALAAPVWDKEPVWVHGDIHAANIIVSNAQVVGIVDFGLAALGDPACDLALAWSFLPATHRDIFFKAAEADEAMVQRGKGWALYVGAIALSYYRHSNPVLARIGEKAISSVLEDVR
jgi:aminoglycoside phosphotransferase (APT) family kinase protein